MRIAIWLSGLAALLVVLFSMSPGVAVAGSTPSMTNRLELPLHFKFINGTARLWTPISIGGSRTVEATIDTGSVGLLVLPSAITDTANLPNLGGFRSSFGGGDSLIGLKTHATIAFGENGASADVPFGYITSAECIPQKPDCPAGKSAFQDYLIANEGLPGVGFKAILGVGMGSSTIGHPLTSIGVSRWIVVIPIPGIKDVGRLILNPDDADLAGFKIFDAGIAFAEPQGVLTGAFPGCLLVRGTGERLCVPICLDTGAAGLTLVTEDEQQFRRVQAGGQFTFEFGNGSDKLSFDLDIPPVGFTLAAPEPDPESPRNLLFAGIRPYLFYEVLYDSNNKQVGLKPR